MIHTLIKIIMSLRSIESYTELQKSLDNNNRNFVLLYKKGSENSDCSYNNIVQVIKSGVEVNVVSVDVSTIRDVHMEYNVTSVPTLLVFKGNKFERTIKGCNDDGYYKSLFESALFSAKQSNVGKQQKRVTVYSTPTCSWCTTLKNHLKNNGITYSEIDVSKDQKAAENMRRRSGQQGVPQTDIGGQMIVGFDKIKINALLNIQ